MFSEVFWGKSPIWYAGILHCYNPTIHPCYGRNLCVLRFNTLRPQSLMQWYLEVGAFEIISFRWVHEGKLCDGIRAHSPFFAIWGQQEAVPFKPPSVWYFCIGACRRLSTVCGSSVRWLISVYEPHNGVTVTQGGPLLWLQPSHWLMEKPS